MNSPETPLYTKGQVLFNLDKAKADMRSHDFALLVEGQMDCISVYMAGIKNVLATSGTAFTEAQIRLLGRFTKRVVVNFDPDDAGTAAAEKSIALLTEEGFEVKVITLEGGLDPDRFVRENGIQAYMAALRTAKRHSDYLIERAQKLFPGRTPDAKVKALNFLLPHIRRMPNRIHRDEFAADAAQKLGIDSDRSPPGAQAGRRAKARASAPAAYTRQRNRTSPPPRPRVARGDDARAAAANGLAEHPDWYEGMGAAPLFDALAQLLVPRNPLDAAPDDATRACSPKSSPPSPTPTPPSRRSAAPDSKPPPNRSSTPCTRSNPAPSSAARKSSASPSPKPSAATTRSPSTPSPSKK